MKSARKNIAASIAIGLTAALAAGLVSGPAADPWWRLIVGAVTGLPAALAFGLATDAIAAAVSPVGGAAPTSAVMVGGKVARVGSSPEPQPDGTTVAQQVDECGRVTIRDAFLAGGEDTVHHRQLFERRLVPHGAEPAPRSGQLIKDSGRLARVIITEMGIPPGHAAIQLWDREQKEDNGNDDSRGSRIGPRIKVGPGATLPVDLDVPFGMGVFLEVIEGSVEVMAYQHGSGAT